MWFENATGASGGIRDPIFVDFGFDVRPPGTNFHRVIVDFDVATPVATLRGAILDNCELDFWPPGPDFR